MKDILILVKNEIYFLNNKWKTKKNKKKLVEMWYIKVKRKRKQSINFPWTKEVQLNECKIKKQKK